MIYKISNNILFQHPKIDTNLSTKDSTYPLTYALRNTSFEDSEYLWNSFVEAGADINCKGSGDSVSIKTFNNLL